MMLTTLLARRLLRDTLIGLTVLAALIAVAFMVNMRMAANQREAADTAASYERSAAMASKVAAQLREIASAGAGSNAEELRAAASRLGAALAALPPNFPRESETADRLRGTLQRLARPASGELAAAEAGEELDLVEGHLLPALRAAASLHRDRAVESSRRLRDALVVSAFLGVAGIFGLGALMLRSMVNRVEAATWELLEAHQRAEHLAFHDPLTGLPNRRYLNDHLNRTLTRAGRRSLDVGLLHLDLDRFKEINDTLGHSAGDEALKLAAGAMSGALRRGDFLARVGGDEFAVVVTEIGGIGALTSLAERLIDSVRSIELPSHFPTALGLSAGIAIAEPGCGYDPTALLRRADEALYRAKEAGRGVHRLDLAEHYRAEVLRAAG